MEQSLENKREELRGWMSLRDNVYFRSYQLALLADSERSKQIVFDGAPPEPMLLVEREQQIGRVGALQFALGLVDKNITALQQELKDNETVSPDQDGPNAG